MTADGRRAGDQIGNRYRIISQLGAGGMGVTYRAWDEIAGIPVVMKEPQKQFLHVPGFIARFQREIQALVRHPHPNIVPILDVGSDEGIPFYVMRFLPGGSLSNRRLRDAAGAERQMMPGTLHLWMWQITAALDFIHAAGIVHRDVKPANVFFDSGWTAFLGDFGVVKDATSSDGQDLTGVNDVVGTHKYLAPEQPFTTTSLDGRADQYALAVIAYDLVAGRPPFVGSNASVIFQKATQPAPPISQFRQDLSPGFQAALHRALATKPEERFGSCSEFVSTLLRDVPMLTDEPGIARFLCPKCDTILRLPLSAAGQQGRCPRCRRGMMVSADLSALWLVSEASSIAQSTAAEAATVFVDNEPGPPPDVPRPGRPRIPPVAPGPSQASLAALAVALLAVAVLALWPSPKAPHNSLEAAWQTLDRNPKDPAANDLVGRSYARRGDWPRALPHLEASKRPDYRAPARLEREARGAARPDAGQLLAVSRTWWKLAGAFPADSPDRQAIEAHAAEVYLEIVGQLVDLGDIEEADQWLDGDAEFRRIVGNQRPRQVNPRVREQSLRDVPMTTRSGTVAVHGTSLMMRPAANGEARAVFTVPSRATSLVGSVQVAGNQMGGQVVAQVARPEGAVLWQSRAVGGPGSPTAIQIPVSGMKQVELRTKIPADGMAVEWVDARFVVPE